MYQKYMSMHEYTFHTGLMSSLLQGLGNNGEKPQKEVSDSLQGQDASGRWECTGGVPTPRIQRDSDRGDWKQC